MQKMKRLMRSLSVVLALALLLTSIPTDGLAATANVNEITDAELKKALAEDTDEYPNGGLEFFQAQLVGTEGDKQLALTVVRRGGTEEAATVDFKAVDVSASYGEDYTLSVKKSALVKKVLEKTSGSKALTEFYSQQGQETDKKTEVAKEETATTETKDTEKASKKEKKASKKEGTEKKSALHAAKDDFLEQDTEAYDWREAQGEEEAKAQELANQGKEAVEEFAQDVEGVGCELTFKKGEFKKEILIDIVDDKLSETDEQVMFLLSNAQGAEIAATTTAYLNIKDNDNNEKVVFAMDKDSVNVDASAKKAEITVKRISGKAKMASVTIGTGAQTAKAGKDYVSFKKQVIFPQGVTEQTVEVELLGQKNAEDRTFQVALDAEESYVKEGASVTTVTIAADAKAAKRAAKNSDQDESASAQAASDWSDSRSVSASASVKNAGGKSSGKKTFLTVDLSTADYVDVTWRSNEGSTTVKEEYQDGCETRTRNKTFNGRKAYIYINGQMALSKGSDPFNNRTDRINLRDVHKTTSGTFAIGVETNNNNKNATAHVSKVVIHYPGYQFTVTNTPFNDGGNSNQYIEKMYTADGDKVDSNGHRYKEGNELTLATLQVSKNGKGAYSDSVTLHRSADTLTFNHKASKTATKHGVSVDLSATGNTYLAGYQLQKRGASASWSSIIKPDDLKFSKEFIASYKNYLLNGNEFRIRPVYRPYTANVYLQNTESSKGSYNNGFKNNEVFRCTQLDTIELKGIANQGYAVDGFNLGTCYGNPNFHVQSSSKNVLATKGDAYKNMSQANAEKEIKTYASPNYTKVAVSNAKTSSAITNVITFAPTKEFTFTNMSYSTPTITAKINPKSENQDKGAIVYTPKDSAGNPQTDGVKEGNASTPLVIDGVTLNQEYTLNAVTEEGYKALFQNFTGDANGDGKIDMKEENVVAEYNIIRTANNGNAYSFRPVLTNTLIYYAFQKTQENRYAGTLDGVVALKTKPIFGTEESIKAINGAVVTAAGLTATTQTDATFGGYEEDGGDGYFSIASRDFAVGDNVTVNVSYNNLNVSATQAVNAAQKYVIDAYDTIGVLEAGLYQVGNEDAVTQITPGLLSNADKTFRIEIKTVAKNDSLEAQKANFKFYRQDGTEITSAAKTVTSDNEVFILDFNPATESIPAGATMTVQFEDQNGTKYFEHDMGVVFARSLGVLSFISSFNFGGANKVLDMVGKIDSAFNFGWDGDIDEKSDYVSTSGDGQEKMVSLGFSFGTEWDNSDDNAAKEEAVKAAAQDEGVSGATNAMRSKVADDSIDSQNPAAQSKAQVGVGATFNCSFGLKITMALSTQDGHKGEWYFKEMMLVAQIEGGVTVNVSYMTPIGIPVLMGLEAGGSGAATFVIEQNYDKKEVYFQDIAGNDGSKIDLFDFNSNNGDASFAAYGVFNVSPYIDLNVGVGFDLLNVRIGGRAAFDMTFYTRNTKNHGTVDLSAYIRLKVLIFEKQWDVCSKKFNLFGGDSSSMPTLTDESYIYASLAGMELEDTSYLKNRTAWNGEAGAQAQSIEGSGNTTELTILQGMYPDADIQMETFGDGKILAVFLDKDTDRNEFNSTALYYTVYSNEVWSEPKLVEDDGKLDSDPCIYNLGTKGIFVAWSNSNEAYTEKPEVLESLSNMDIHGRFFNRTTEEFSDDIEIITKTKPYTCMINGVEMYDYAADVNPQVSYDAAANKMIVFYTKNEYEAGTGIVDENSSEETGVYGDAVNPYSLIAYRTYDFDTQTWLETYPDNPTLSEDYIKAWYGQRFLDTELRAHIDETIDEEGFWTADPRMIGYSQENYIEPLVVEQKMVTYNNLAILTYIADYDRNKATEDDRDIIMQFYDYKTDTVSHPILVTTSKTVGERELNVEYSGNSAIMTYISNGTLCGENVSNIVENLSLDYTKDTNMYVIDRNRGVEGETKSYQPVMKIAGKEANQTGDVNIEEDGEGDSEETMEEEEFLISNVNLSATDRYVYAVWTQTDTKLKEGVDAKSEDAAKPENTLIESQIYAMRFDNYNGIMTQPVQVTEGAGCNYSNLDYVAANGEDGEITLLALKAGTTVEQGTAEAGDSDAQNTDPYPAVDYDNSSFVSLKFKPTSVLKVEDISVQELTAGAESPVSIKLYNDGLQTLTDLTLTATDKDGKEIYKQVVSVEAAEAALAESETADVVAQLYGGESMQMDFNLALDEDATEGSFSYKVVDNKTSKVLIEDTYKEEIPVELDVTSFKAQLLDRETAQFALQVTNNGRCKSGEQTIVITQEFEDGKEQLVEIPVESLIPGESKYIEEQYTIANYRDMFQTEISETEGFIAVADFKATSSAGTNASTDITLSATKEQRLRVAAIQKLQEVDDNNFKIEVGGVSQLGIQIESIPYAGSRYNGVDKEATGASGLRVLYKTKNSDIIRLYDNGYYEGLKEGIAEVTAYILPNSNEVTYDNEEGSLVKDNFTTLPEEMIRIRSFKVAVGEATPAPTATPAVTPAVTPAPTTTPVPAIAPSQTVGTVQFDSKSVKIGLKESILLMPKLSKNSTDSLKDATYKVSGKSVKIKKLASGNVKVTGKKKGKSTITVTTASGAKAKITVNVRKAPKSIKAKKKNITLKIGKTKRLGYKLSKGSASYNIQVRSNKKRIVRIVSGTKIKALKKGTATITLRTYNNKKVKIKVKVKK